MTLEQLRIFVAVAERQHVTRGARDINVTQSAASAAIAVLEERYSLKLFNRVGLGIELTEAGRTFLGDAKAVLVRAASAECTLHDLVGLKRGSISLFASQTIASYWLPPVMNRFYEAFPGIALRLTIANTEQVANATRDGEADIGFVKGVVDDPMLACRSMMGDELVIVVGPSYPWASIKKLSSSDLSKTTSVLRERGSGTRSMFGAALMKVGIRLENLNVTLELPSNEAVRAAVESGGSAAALSLLVVHSSIRSGTLVSPNFALTKHGRFSFSITRSGHRAVRQGHCSI